MWQIQDGNFTTSKKLDVDLFLLEFITTKIVKWKFHVDESSEGGYDIILGRDLLAALVLGIKFYDNVIISNNGPY